MSRGHRGRVLLRGQIGKRGGPGHWIAQRLAGSRAAVLAPCAGAFQLNETTIAAWDESCRCAAILRATAILLQCPASFRATDENIAAMRAFLRAVHRPPGVRLMWEPRGPWPADVVPATAATPRA